jgi:antitoxin (DNA-binding transcriptional repressor) of toxin-antitoxin stability system
MPMPATRVYTHGEHYLCRSPGNWAELSKCNSGSRCLPGHIRLDQSVDQLILRNLPMTPIGLYHAKAHLPKLIERVAQGEKILITRRGVAVALLTQPPQQHGRDVRQVVEDMLAFRDRFGPKLGKRTIREVIEDGRRY